MIYCRYILPLIFVTTVFSTVIELNTEPEGFLSIRYRFVGDPYGPYQALLLHDAIPERGRLDGSDLILNTVDDEQITCPSLLYYIPGTLLLCIATGFNSVFATHFATTYMMIPSNRQLIINPANPRDFVNNGILPTARSTSEHIPQVGVSVSLLNTTPRAQDGAIIPSEIIESTETYDFVVATAKREDYVPQSIIVALHDDLERRGIPCDPDYGTDGTMTGIDIFGDLTDETIDTFPIIQYRIHGEAGEDILIQLVGRDYVGPLDDDLREVRLRSGDALNGFGLNTLSKVALFIDNRNRTIGFGDPL